MREDAIGWYDSVDRIAPIEIAVSCWSDPEGADNGGCDRERLAGLRSIDSRERDWLIALQSIETALERSMNVDMW